MFPGCIATLQFNVLNTPYLTAHTYHEKVAEGIYRKLAQYADLMRKWLSEMDKRAS